MDNEFKEGMDNIHFHKQGMNNNYFTQGMNNNHFHKHRINNNHFHKEGMDTLVLVKKTRINIQNNIT